MANLTREAGLTVDHRNETSLLTIWTSTKKKSGLVGIHGFLIGVLYYPFVDKVLPGLSIDSAVMPSLFSGSLTILGFVAAGLAVVIGSGSQRLIAVMYRGRHFHAFMLHFIWISLSWSLSAFVALAVMLGITSHWVIGASIALFAYSLTSTIDILLSLVRFGILSAQEAAAEIEAVLRPLPSARNAETQKK